MNTQLIISSLLSLTIVSRSVRHSRGDVVGVKDNEVCLPIAIALGLCNNNVGANVLAKGNKQAMSTGKGDSIIKD